MYNFIISGTVRNQLKPGKVFGFINFVCSGVSAGFMSLLVRVVLGSMRWFASAGEQVVKDNVRAGGLF